MLCNPNIAFLILEQIRRDSRPINKQYKIKSNKKNLKFIKDFIIKVII